MESIDDILNSEWGKSALAKSGLINIKELTNDILFRKG